MNHRLFIFAACCLLSLLLFPQTAFAWGGGHSTIGSAIAANLPEPWKSKLQDTEVMAQFLRDNTYPDSFEPITVDRAGEEAVRYLNSVNITRRYDFHGDPGREAAFSLLVQAIRDSKPDRVFLWLGILAHSYGDMPSCNHDPLIHTTIYIWNERSWNIDSPVRREGSVDLVWIEKYPWAGEIFRRTIEARRLTDDGADAGEALVRVMLCGFEGVDVGSPHGRPLLENSVRWAVQRDQEAGERIAEILSEIGAWAVVRVLRDFQVALRLAETDVDVKHNDRVQAEYVRQVERLLRDRSLDDDSIARDLLLDKAETAPSIAVLYEPVWRMNDSAFAFGDQVTACQIVSSLRSLGHSAGLLDVRTFQQDGIADVARIPILVVPATNVRNYRIIERRVLLEQVNDYLERNGKILWVGGNQPPVEVFPELSAGIPLTNREFSTQKIMSDFGDGNQEEWRFVRFPQGQAGWNWAPLPSHFEQNDPETFRVLLRLTSDDGTFDVGAALPGENSNRVFLPSMALFPYILTDETPELLPLSLKLDSVGTLLLDRSIRLIGNE